MTQEEIIQELLEFFKALADANRLRIVGLLAQENLSVEQMAEMLDLHASTVSHHLSKLSKAGLVSARAEGHYSIYQLNTRALEEMAKRLLSDETLPAAAAGVDVDAYDRKVLSTYMDAQGRFKSLPTQRKKLEVLLRYTADRFESGRKYAEKEVNTVLGELTDDISGVRRDLIDLGFLARERDGSAYWRV